MTVTSIRGLFASDISREIEEIIKVDQADERIVREIIPKLKVAGAEGIIEYPLNKVVY